MNSMEVLREYNNIDGKLETEKMSIKMGKDYIRELYNTYQSLKKEHGGEYERIKGQLCQEEWQHFMEYRRLLKVKTGCLRALQSLTDEEAQLLRERAVEGKAWSQLSAVHSYSVSQLRRRFYRALSKFAEVYRNITLENERK